MPTDYPAVERLALEGQVAVVSGGGPGPAGEPACTIALRCLLPGPRVCYTDYVRETCAVRTVRVFTLLTSFSPRQFSWPGGSSVSPSKQALYAAGQSGAWLSLSAYLLLAAVKLAVGVWAQSRGLTADGINNVTDVLASVAVLVGLRTAGRPADDDHPYGHHKAETVAAIIVAAIMALVGMNLLVSAIQSILAPAAAPPEPAAGWVAAGAAAVMWSVYTYNLRLARRTGSGAVRAAAYDNRSDALVSVAALVGIAGARIGWNWADPAAAAAVSLSIMYTAWHIGAPAAHALTDGFDQRRTRDLIARVGRVKGVQSVTDLRARNMGLAVAVDVTIRVKPTLNVVDAHAVADRVEDALRRDPDVEQVQVHVEPDDLAAAPRR